MSFEWLSERAELQLTIDMLCHCVVYLDVADLRLLAANAAFTTKFGRTERILELFGADRDTMKEQFAQQRGFETHVHVLCEQRATPHRIKAVKNDAVWCVCFCDVSQDLQAASRMQTDALVRAQMKSEFRAFAAAVETVDALLTAVRDTPLLQRLGADAVDDALLRLKNERDFKKIALDKQGESAPAAAQQVWEGAKPAKSVGSRGKSHGSALHRLAAKVSFASSSSSQSSVSASSRIVGFFRRKKSEEVLPQSLIGVTGADAAANSSADSAPAAAALSPQTAIRAFLSSMPSAKFAEFRTLLARCNAAALNQRDSLGYTLLHTAMTENDDRYALALLANSDVDVSTVNHTGNTAMHFFAQRWSSPTSVRTVFGLLSQRAGAGGIASKNDTSETPLHKAVFNACCRLLIVPLLLSHADCDVNAVNFAGDTPLHYAARLCRIDLIEVLLTGGADRSIENHEGHTPLSVAGSPGAYAALLLSGSPEADASSTLLRQAKSHRLRSITTVQKNANRLRVSMRRSFRLPSKAPAILQPAKAEPAAAPSAVPERVHTERSSASERISRNDMSEYVVQPGSALFIDFNKLEFLNCIGEGQSATVFRGDYDGRECAIKVIRQVVDEESILDLKKEFAILCELRNERFVQFFGVCVEPQVCLAMELCSGGPLYDALRNKALNIGWALAVRWLHDIIDGIQALHDWKPNPVVHRDLKTLNVLLTSDARIKLCDFGLSRFASQQAGRGTLKKLRGTMSYFDPVVYQGDAYTLASDVYAFGICMWEVANRCATGESPVHPFASFDYIKHDFQLIARVSRKNLRPPLVDNIPSEIETIIKECWSGVPDERPTAKQVGSRLRTFYAHGNWEELDATRTVAGEANKVEEIIPEENNDDNDDDNDDSDEKARLLNESMASATSDNDN